MKNKILIAILSTVLSGCVSNNQPTDKIVSTNKLGQITFERNCAVCHGQKAQGLTENWKIKVNGKYPAPPLNGTAHTWHHSPAVLLRIINEGGTTMVGFKNQLSAKQKQAVLEYLHSLWPLKIQKAYNKRFNL